MKAFSLLYQGGFLFTPGAYNHILDLGNIYGVTFWSKFFTVGTNLVEASWPPRVKQFVAIAM